MLTSEYKIKEFPDGEDYWLIKWIDEFQLAHLKTRSTSVGVILQKLKAKDVTELNSATTADVPSILGKDVQENIPIFSTLRVLVGTLPLLQIGQIYKNGILAANLPTLTEILTWSKGDEDIEVTLGQETKSPAGWKPGLPHKILNAFEYFGLLRSGANMGRSRCQVITAKTDSGIDEFVIPRTTLFKAFYAQQTEIAKAFCRGPWSQRFKDVICMSEFQSGIKTKVSHEGRQWDLVLETLVPDKYLAPLALLYFDDYARKCAESIYTASLQDRAGKMHAPWYASAKIPYLPKNEPFRMVTQCLPLKPWGLTKSTGNQYRKFLVTSITGSSWPSHLPPLGLGRRNMATTSDNQISRNEPAPYSSGRPRSNKAVSLNSGHDARRHSSIIHVDSEDWIWLTAPKIERLTKESSNAYEGARKRSDECDDLHASLGEHTSQADSLTIAETVPLKREPQKRFEQIIQILHEMRDAGKVEAIRVVSSPRRWQQTECGGRSCWSFITERAAIQKRKTGKSWRILEYASSGTKEHIYRSALVLELIYGGAKHYWIEIECRKKEHGFRSVLLSNLGDEYLELIGLTIDIVAEVKGIKLERELSHSLSEFHVEVASYKHRYESQTDSNLDAVSVRQFLFSRKARREKR